MIPHRYAYFLPFLFILIVCGSVGSQQIERFDAVVFRDGKELRYPFAGGLDAPQFSAADLNLDGVKDIFVFDRQGYVPIPFVSVFNGSSYDYEIDWNILTHLPRLQQWALMYDFNSDGVDDLIASTLEPGVQGVDVYRGSDAGGKILFTQMTFDIGDYSVLYFNLGQSYTPLYVAWIDVPAVADVDGDGDTDILTFDPGGSYIHYFRNLGVEQGFGLDTFILDWEDECWGKIYEDAFSETILLSNSPNTCASDDIVAPRHSGSALAVLDLESDGDMDLYVGDLASARITELLNGGSAMNAWMTSQENQFPADNVPVDIPFFVSPFILDVNHDDIPDLVAASNNTAFSENYEVSWYYENDGNGNFSLQDRSLFVGEMLDFGTESKPAFFDYNADGLMDILVGTGGYFTPEGNRDARLVLLKNEGTPDTPVFRVADEDYQGFSTFVSIPTYEFAPTAGDIDQDGDIDVLVGERNGGLFFLENTAGPDQPVIFASPVYPYADINVGSSSKPCLIDLSGDGMPDIVCGERLGNNDNEGRCSNLNYYENLGTPGQAGFDPDITSAPNTDCLGRVLFGTQTLPAYSSPECVLTPDGLILLTGSETGVLRMYSGMENNIDGEFQLDVTGYGNIADGTRSVPALADIDEDGFYEMILGNKRGGLTMYNTDIRKGTTAVSDELPESVIALVPNPTSHDVRVHLERDMRIVSVRIFDSTGRVVSKLSNVMNASTVRLPDASGIYFAEIQTDHGRYVQRIMKL